MNSEINKCIKLCRLCDQFTTNTCSIYDKCADGKQIINLVKECLPIIVRIFINYSTLSK